MEKQMATKGIIIPITLIAIIMTTAASSAQTTNFADYFPLGLGSYWTYRNTTNYTDNYNVSVTGPFTYREHVAVKLGTGTGDYVFCDNNGVSASIFGGASGTVTIGDFNDGDFFNFMKPTNFVLLRLYDNLDPNLKSVYDVNEPNLVLWVTYDKKYPKNLQNNIVESNLAVSIPDYAVTGISWYAKNIGEVIKLDVDAVTGNLGKRYQLYTYNVVSRLAQFGTINKKNVNLTLKDCNNNSVMFSLTGGGYGEANMADCNFSEITLYDTTEKSRLTISTKGRTQTSVGDITVNGSLKTISAGNVNVRESIALDGSLSSLTANNLNGFIIIGSASNRNAAVTLSFAKGDNLEISSQIPIKSISAMDWDTGMLTGPSVGSIKMKANSKLDRLGYLGANINIAGAIKTITADGEVHGNWKCKSINNLTVLGADDFNLILSQEPNISVPAIGKLTAKGILELCQIRSSGNIGSFTAGSMISSFCFAGIANGVTGLPLADANDFNQTAEIGSFVIKGIKGQSPPFFGSSNVAAYRISSISVAYPDYNNFGTPFGFTMMDNPAKSVTIIDSNDKHSWKGSQIGSAIDWLSSLSNNDMEIRSN